MNNATPLTRGHSLCLSRSAGTSKDIKLNIEPLVYLTVDAKVLVTDLLGRETFFYCLGLCRCAVFISTTHVQCVVVTQTTVSVK